MGEVLDDGEKEYRYLIARQRIRSQERAEKFAPWFVVLYLAWIPLLALLVNFWHPWEH